MRDHAVLSTTIAAPGGAPYVVRVIAGAGQAGHSGSVIGLLPFALVLGLEVPWTCGDTYPVTQGHNTGSHTGNGAWAWDFGLPVGTEVRAAAPGTVTYIKMNGNQGGCDQSFSSHANYVVVDHGDGTQALYLHLELSSSPLEIGDQVWPGDLVGRVGLTGWVCGAHLHFQVEETCGSYWCPSVPSTFTDYGDPPLGTQVTSTNCPPCMATLDGGETEIDELDTACFERQTQWWWSSSSGLDGHHFYTIASDVPTPETLGAWHFGVATPGDYRVEVFIPDEDADAQGAVYEVHHDAGVELVPIDQSTHKGWRELGTFGFSGGDGERIQLGDNTGENTELQRRLAYDSVRLTFVPVEEGTSSGGGGDDTTGTSTSGTGSTSVGADDADTGEYEGTWTDALPPGDDPRGQDSGCACSTGRSAPPPGALFFGALGIVLAVRRRR